MSSSTVFGNVGFPNPILKGNFIKIEYFINVLLKMNDNSEYFRYIFPFYCGKVNKLFQAIKNYEKA